MHAHQSIPEVIGLIPAGGQATRLAPIPSSKELYPIGFRAIVGDNLRPKDVSNCLLENTHLADVRKASMILRAGKWNIPAYYGDDVIVGMHLGYLTVQLPYDVPVTLSQAYPFIRHALIAVTFPDILFQPKDTFKHMLARQAKTQADVVVGVVPFETPHKGGMVDFDVNGQVHQLLDKPTESHLMYSWHVAVWAPKFTKFMHQFLAAIKAKHNQKSQIDPSYSIKEIPLGTLIQAEIAQGLRVEAEVFPEGGYLDIGTPGNLVKAVCYFANQDFG